MLSILEGPPEVPNHLDDIVYYKLQSKQYYERLKSIVWIFVQIVATLLVLGVIWITVDWVKILVSAIAIALSLLLIIVLFYIF